jgi:hypothetical protein
MVGTQQVQKLEKDFEVLDLYHVPRVHNAVINDLSTKAPTWAWVPDGVFERRLQRPLARPAELGEPSTSNLAVSVALHPWSPPKIINVTGESVHPVAQDPEVQDGPDTWITEIWTHLKDNIVLDEHASAE